MLAIEAVHDVIRVIVLNPGAIAAFEGGQACEPTRFAPWRGCRGV